MGAVTRSNHRLSAVVPVKRFAHAKARLSSCLDRHERAELARLMLLDVLDALEQCVDLSSVLIVTADSEAAMLSARRRIHVVHQADDCGVNAALASVCNKLTETDADAGLLVVPADIPHLSVASISAAVHAVSKPRSIALAAAHADGGTNLLACRPVAALPLTFGPSSFQRHLEAAVAAGLDVTILTEPDVRLDIDRPDDLHEFLALRSNSRTHEFLARTLRRSTDLTKSLSLSEARRPDRRDLRNA